jgi:peptidyl-prolyl cis-trans isomerase A (cyclophilin A)
MFGLILVVLLAGLQQSAAPAPALATLTGTVYDREGGLLPGVTVALEGASPSASQKVVTNVSGTWRIDNIQPGVYTLRFELAGFTTYERPRLTLAAGQTLALKVGLDIGPLVIVDRVQGVPEAKEPTFPLTEGEVALGVDTAAGTFYIAVDTKRAPVTAKNFLDYADAGLYNGGRFHRATRADNYTPAPPNRPMMNIIQGGINQSRRGESRPPIPLERTSVTGIKHVTGVISMARGTGADTATSDFFVLLDDQPSLDHGGLRFDDGQGGAAFGRVLSGLDVVRRIQQQPVEGQNLTAPVAIQRVWRLGKQ